MWVLGQTFRTAEPRRSVGSSARRLRGARADQGGYPGLLDGPAQSLAEVHLGGPSELLAGQGDVGLADLRVVGGQRLEDDLRARPGDLDDRLGELQQRELVGVADVDRLVQPR